MNSGNTWPSKFQQAALRLSTTRETINGWTPRGDVLRCQISDGGGDDGLEPIVYVDDREFSWHDFGRMLTTYAGWGMRIVFVPDDELERSPRIEVREPDA